MVKGLAHIGLYIRDIERSKAFYGNILGFEIIDEIVDGDSTKICMMKNHSCILELVEFSTFKDKSDGWFDHVALEVDDILETIEDLKKRGIVFETEKPVWDGIFGGSYYIMFRGPDGEHIELDQIQTN